MPPSLRHFSSTDIVERLPELGALLRDCVHDGASIGFILPFDTAASQAFWTDNVLPAVTRGVRLLLVAEVDCRVAGAVQLDWDTNPNQAHRAEVRKLLVAPLAAQPADPGHAQRRPCASAVLVARLRGGGQYPRLCAGARWRPAGRDYRHVQATAAMSLQLSDALGVVAR